MADEPKTVQGTESLKPEKQFSQAELDAIIKDRLRRESEKYADYQDVKTQLETLQAKEKERADAELTESDKLKKQVEELNQSLHETIKQKDEAVKFKTTWEEQEAQKVEKAAEGLTESQKSIIMELPLSKRMDAVNEFKTAKPSPGNWGMKGKEGGPSSVDELYKLRQEYGPDSVQYKAALAERMKAI